MSDNILAVNIPNFVTVVLMGLAGALLAGMLRKLVSAKGMVVQPGPGGA